MLSKRAQTVQDFLVTQEIDAHVLELPEITRTPDEAPAVIRFHVAQIVKSLVFVTKLPKTYPYSCQWNQSVNEKTISKEVGEKICKADADFIREKTGFAIGGIPPIGHKQKMETYIDEDCLNIMNCGLLRELLMPYLNLNLLIQNVLKMERSCQSSKREVDEISVHSESNTKAIIYIINLS